MQATSEQYAAIHNHDENLIVVAGAGSGKTRVLVERYIQLLQRNPDLEPQRDCSSYLHPRRRRRNEESPAPGT